MKTEIQLSEQDYQTFQNENPDVPDYADQLISVVLHSTAEQLREKQEMNKRHAAFDRDFNRLRGSRNPRWP